MARRHSFSIRQFTGWGLWHVAQWRGYWLVPVGWQSGAQVQAAGPLARGWHPLAHLRRLHLTGNHTRFLMILPGASGLANLVSRRLALSLRRLSDDWREAHGHVLELAETFTDPLRFTGRAIGHRTARLWA